MRKECAGLQSDRMNRWYWVEGVRVVRYVKVPGGEELGMACLASFGFLCHEGQDR